MQRTPATTGSYCHAIAPTAANGIPRDAIDSGHQRHRHRLASPPSSHSITIIVTNSRAGIGVIGCNSGQPVGSGED
ncbi:hypothetical protein AND_009508 [Anopheles darlingi]|uniref:Uncharacterized protein n=1 Tax=Anopheles darlingi TaxID=43151 RepID=W5J693_ANODA|nr:hypothetical protein AND_009508 [Anopheles darlingi]